ncbi:ABC-type multidrug transport system, ATPase and permease component [Micromonospora pallida]|uniref:ABC-type multidrug transport system, ATPase and permease component n=1 Tax=Micromonospora pallida TaxID=145854 RepID=A0A1C6SWG8_9ACTN|nr:ABC transporter ATP-binding protein [Micromonospora pallida]SCL33672.1 ABC-type multidrug transport system, ATPase and permease component [Micromonospora pallida]
MRLLRDLWVTSPRRVTFVAVLILLGSAGQAAAAALAGPVLLHRSGLLFVLLAVALVAAVVADLVINLVMAGLTADWTADVRRRLCRVAFGQDLPTLENTPVGELLDRIDNDVYQVGAEVRHVGVRLTQALATGVISTVVALLVWWPAGLGMLLLSGLLLLLLGGPTSRIAPARMAEEEAWSDMAAVMEEAIHGQDDVRTTLARPYVLRLFAQRTAEVLHRGKRVWKLTAEVSTVATVVTRFGIGAVVLAGGWALVTGRVDGARLTAIWLLVLAFGGTVEHLTRMVPQLQAALGAWARVLLLADARQEPTGGRSPVPGRLEIRGLTFRYPTSDSGRGPALRDVHLTFAPGRSYAVVGRTGSGKSTLAKVLSRAVELPPRAVFLAGTDLLDLDLEELRRFVAVVPQRTEILAGTLAENVALFDPELLDDAADALRELGLDEWVAELPDGVDTRLGEGGYVLSAGQEQLVAFARILVRDPRVVILDEATARLDPVTEARVQRATERLLADRIGIVIAHRLSSVRRCDEVVVLADGTVVEAGPLRESENFARLLAASHTSSYAHSSAGTGDGPDGLIDADPDGRVLVTTGGGHDGDGPGTGREGGASGGGVSGGGASGGGAGVAPRSAVAVVDRPAPAEPTVARVEAPPLPAVPPARTAREILRLVVNDSRYGMLCLVMFTVVAVVGLDGSVLPWLWADLVDGVGGVWLPALGIVVALLVTLPVAYVTNLWFPQWWVRQSLRISARLVHGQTGARRVSKHTPAEVVAQGGDTERVVQLADNVMDNATSLVVVAAMTVVSGSVVPGLFFLGTMAVSAFAATLFGPRLERSARATVAARAAFATALVSSLSAARTVKLAGATGPVLDHLSVLDTVRSDRQRREISAQVWSRSTPSVVSGLLPIGAWGLFLTGGLSAGATLVAVSTLGAARWFAWTTASLIAHFPSARVWTRRAVAMTGVAAYSAAVPGVDLAAGTAPAPEPALRRPLRRLTLTGFSAVHEDGLVAVHDIDLLVERGQLVLVVGPVGAGKSSLLRALAGIVHHTGDLSWNGEPVTEPELFLRPNQVGYVGQLPRVLSGTVVDNVTLGHEVDAASAVTTAQLDHDLAAAGAGLGLLIGHKGTRLSGGQLQRLALARALAPQTELLIADDISSALDVTTELALWAALRKSGVTVVGSTSKRAALLQADHVVVLVGGQVVAQGAWNDLSDRWSHLAG